MVLSMKNRGVISTRPPTLIASMVNTASRPMLVSIHSCLKLKFMIYLFPESCVSQLGGQLGFQCSAFAFALTDGHEHVEGHHHHAGQEEHAANGAHRVEGVHGRNRLDERVLEVAELVKCAPHQALGDPGNPHCDDIENDADRGQPEMPLDQLAAVHFWCPTAWASCDTASRR